MRVPAWKPLVAASVLALGQAVVATGPAVAVTPPLTITADMPTAVPAGHNWAFNDFFPSSLRVPQGATIQFAIMGFHTATLLPAGVSERQDTLANGIAKADADDTTPNPGGQSHTMLDIPALFPLPGAGPNPICGFAPLSPCVFDGTGVVSDTALGPPAPFAVTITAPVGTYTFHCRVHPGMSGQLTVVPAQAPGTQPAELQARVNAQLAGDVAGGYAAEAGGAHAAVTRNADGTRTWHLKAGASGAGGRTAVLEFLPQHITIAPGDHVVWTSVEPNEPHTVTFPNDIGTDQVPVCDGVGADTPFTPACPGPPEIEFAPGNGISNVTSPTTVSDSGLLASTKEVRAFGLPSTAALTSWQVSFQGAAAGPYTYVCQIHGPAMGGTITVH